MFYYSAKQHFSTLRKSNCRDICFLLVALSCVSVKFCRLADNPICQETAVTKSYCTVSQPNSSYATPPNNCVPASCFAKQHSSPNCKCAFPYTGLLVFRAPSFSDLGNITYFSVLEKSLMNSFKSHQFPVDSVHLSQPRKDLSQYLDLNLQVFPFGQDRFNRTAILSIGFMLSNQTFKPPAQFGPFFFIGDTYLHFTGSLITDTELKEKTYPTVSPILIVTPLSPPSLFLLIQEKSEDQKSLQAQVLSSELRLVALSFCCYCLVLEFMLLVKKWKQKKQFYKTILLVWKGFVFFTWQLHSGNFLDLFCFIFSTLGIKQWCWRCSSVKRSQMLLFWRTQKIHQQLLRNQWHWFWGVWKG